MFTFEAAVNSFFGGGRNLADDAESPGIVDGFLAFYLSTNTAAAVTFSVDNLRIIFEGVAAIVGDFVGSGSVGQVELNAVLLNWGQTAEGESTPAPKPELSALGVSLLMLRIRCRRDGR